MLRVCYILLLINLVHQLLGIETFGIQWLSKVKVLLLTSAGLGMVVSICVVPQMKRAYEKRGRRRRRPSFWETVCRTTRRRH